MKAMWKGTVVAESDETIIVESNHYFPRSALQDGYFKASDKTTYCGWKGEANYLSITINDETNQDAAWYYDDPKTAAEEIQGMVAFWRGVEVTK